MSDSEETVDMEFIVEGVLMLGVSTAGVILNIFRWIEFPTRCLELCAPNTFLQSAKVSKVKQMINIYSVTRKGKG